jgi:glycosyltransferase involved in cell wall biosynthesis
MSPSISVLINNHNYGRYLPQAIGSALAQTGPPVEVVVVDDGSTDDSAAAIRAWGDRIVAVFQENRGQAAAINRGFAASTGEIIMLLDADDYLLPDATARLVALWTPQTGALHHRLRMVDEAGLAIGFSPPDFAPLEGGDLAPQVMRTGGAYRLPATSGRAFSRRVFAEMSPIPEEFRRSADAYLRVMAPLLTPITVVEEPLACYRIHDANGFGSLSRPTRRQVELWQHYNEKAQNYLRLAAIRQGKQPPDTRSWETFDDAFQKLLLARGEAPPDGATIRRRAVAALRKLGDEKGRSVAWRLVKLAAVVFVLAAPASWVRRRYPYFFETAAH